AKILKCVPPSVVKIVDTEGERLKESLKCGVKLVKPNLEELERTLKIHITDKDDMLKACRVIINSGCEYVLLSLGKKGAVITDGIKSYYCKSVSVAMNSTIGAGDGMVAAATNALIKGGSMQDILRCGVAGGSAAVTLPDSISFMKDKYEEILSSLTVEQI
ncbi:MAG: bifunctional hydroxymethylpyrimidine kinase/phosphomethylpyrimidine kinase, partial [Clostridia bacterium]|nr:bifunctional hydroxymethylpyrimidine kinase/phosphomethylpyrimidine kinase [Clostridia bacterium]